MVLQRRLSVLLAACSVAGCLSGNSGDPPCSGDQCPQGRSCLINKCIPNGSLGSGDTCDADEQCSSGLACAPNLFVCLPPCPLADADTTAGCKSGHYCAPLPELSSTQSGATQYATFCASSQCTSDQDCGAGNTCVLMASHVGACETGCEITWVGFTYADNCGGTAINPEF